ncbi:MAG TPA: hypothetical protein VMG59_09495 [Phycisphaerae bacterium]|nr:hypothetical protein [Phycisphaerae bacterium]
MSNKYAELRQQLKEILDVVNKIPKLVKILDPLSYPGFEPPPNKKYPLIGGDQLPRFHVNDEQKCKLVDLTDEEFKPLQADLVKRWDKLKEPLRLIIGERESFSETETTKFLNFHGELADVISQGLRDFRTVLDRLLELKTGGEAPNIKTAKDTGNKLTCAVDLANRVTNSHACNDLLRKLEVLALRAEVDAAKSVGETATAAPNLIQFPADVHTIVAKALRHYAEALRPVREWKLNSNSEPEDFFRCINRAGLPSFYDGHCLEDVISQGLIALGLVDDAASFGRRTGKMPSCWREWAKRMNEASNRTKASVYERQKSGKLIEPLDIWGPNLLMDFEELKQKTGEVEAWLNDLARHIDDTAFKPIKASFVGTVEAATVQQTITKNQISKTTLWSIFSTALAILLWAWPTPNVYRHLIISASIFFLVLAFFGLIWPHIKAKCRRSGSV